MSNVYDSLTDDRAQDHTQWAFGTDAEDPLAGVDTTIPDGVDAAGLARLCLELGDDALVYAHRLSEWCSNAPDLEEDVALANIALDLLGQARLLLTRAAAADPGLVPELPAGSPVTAEDALAFFRDADAFRNRSFVAAENGDFAVTIARLTIFSTYRLALLSDLVAHPDPVLSAIAAKGVKEVTYHRDYAARWFVTLAQGTAESRRRLVDGCDLVWASAGDMLGAPEVDAVIDQVLLAAALERPQVGRRELDHNAVTVPLLAELQVVARAHPLGRW